MPAEAKKDRHRLRWLHTGEGPLTWSGEEAVDVLRFALRGLRYDG
jgi:hypothetical protein